jgi:hypothetical protein
MKGIAATIGRLLWGNALQRWFLAIGLLLIGSGFSALVNGWYPVAQPLFATAVVMGVVAAAGPPLVLAPILFGALAAPRAVSLIPYGRFKLLLGALITQLLLALFISITLGALLAADAAASNLSVRVFAISFGALTVFFLNTYWFFRFRPAFLLFLLYPFIPPLLSALFSKAHLGRLLITPMGLAGMTAVSLLVWAIFGVAFLRAGHVSLPLWNINGPGTTGARSALMNPTSTTMQFSQREAVRILLTGTVNMRPGVLMLGLLAGGLVAVLGILTASGPNGPVLILSWAVICCFSAAMIPMAVTGLMVRRAKFLWLTAAMGRAELFTAVERYSWRVLFVVAGIALLFAIPMLAYSIHAHPANLPFISILAIPFAAGASMFYGNMSYIRGTRLRDILLFLVVIALLLADMICGMVLSRTPLLPAVIGAQVILVPLLRALAQKRWQTIDWLINRLPNPAARLT